ncbi:integral membrane protein PTH11 [Fusarium sp. NRRL 52700]|nr:integral membrane protein PTH11 [Fusarium sp. NRRL 52700]
MDQNDSGTAASMVFRRGYVPVSDLPTNSTQQTGIAIICFMTSLAFVTWGTRMYSRFSKKQIGIDDWFVTVAMLFSIGLHVPYYYFFRYDYIGFHTKDLPKSYDIEPVLFYNWIMQVLYNPILALVKSSILFFLLRLGGHKRGIKWTIYGLNAFNVAFMIAIFLTVLFQTIPINAYWDLSIKPERHIDGPLFYISSAIITIITDILVLLIPFWIFLGLKMRIAAKLGLIVVFLMGGVVTIVAILRVIELYKKFYVKGYDSRHSLGDTLSSIEVNLAIIACCGPALRPLFRRMFPRLFSGKSTNDTAKYNTPSRYGNGTAGVSSFHLKDMHRSRTQTEIRGYSPNGSEEEIMTYNGILRTTAVDIKYNDAQSTDTDQVVEGARGHAPL